MALQHLKSTVFLLCFVDDLSTCSQYQVASFRPTNSQRKLYERNDNNELHKSSFYFPQQVK